MRIATLSVAVVTALGLPAMAGAATTTTISTDPFTQATCAASALTNHHTEVEPDTFANGSTIVSAFQVGRIYDGGACAIGFATSTNNGASWTSGLLPGVTKYSGSSLNDRATDAAVAYDAAHGVWLVSSLTLLEAGGVRGNSVVTSRSTDGLTWSTPFITATGGDLDKNWIACDNTSTSPFYGHCYTQWDDHGAGNLLEMSTSTDGGQHWSAPATNGAGVIGGQPVVRPNGTVIVPIANASDTAIGAFNSTNGGLTWSFPVTFATVRHHTVAGSLRESPLPSAEIDGAGNVFVAWADCRFRRSCKTNDIVFSKSLDATGTSWSAVTRVPIDGTSSNVDHFIPGLAVNKATSNASAKLGLTYYFYPAASKRTSPSLSVGFISSSNAGSTWSSPTTLASGMPSTWTAPTSQGRMVGDYISTSYGSDNLAHGVFATASAPTSGTSCSETLDNCLEPTATFTTGLAAGGSASGAADAVLFSGNANVNAKSFWNVVDNNGSKHR
jgi:hypothetical protein